MHGSRAVLSHVGQEPERIAGRYVEALPPAAEDLVVVRQQAPQERVHGGMAMRGGRQRHGQGKRIGLRISLSAQARYAAGTREILECYFAGQPIRNEYLIVQGGKLAGVGARSYGAGNATKGSEEAARFKK